jgi:RNA polymerase sigma-70 factor (ECF subfamily)
MVGGLVGAAAVPNEPHGDERELVLRVQHGDRAAFDELARRHARRAFAIAYRILRHTQDAEDLVQDAFIATLDGIGTFDPARPFAPWFFKIVVNRALNAVSARSTRERHVTVTPLWSSEAASVEFDPAERSEIRQRFREALTALPQQQRIIGEMLDLPSGTVRWHLHQARKALRVALAGLLEGTP